jgi:hypothetical protein
MQAGLVWLPARGVELDSAHATSIPQPGFEKTLESSISAGPGWPSAAIYLGD